MSVDTYEQMTTGVSDITSIALVTLEIINNTLLINELRLWFVCRELMGNLAARKHWLDINLELHRSKTSSVRKHYDNRHPGRIPDDLHSCFKVLKKCQNKFDCLVNEMLLIKQLRPCLNVQSDSIRAKVFV